MSRILPWILGVLGFTAPLIFSHLFYAFGLVIEPVGYEILKRVYIAGFLFVVFLFLVLQKRLIISRWVYISLFVMLVVLGIQAFEVSSIPQIFLWDVYFEYGGGYMLLIVSIFLIACNLNSREISALAYGLVASTIPLGIYAWAQYLGYDFLQYDASFNLKRSFSTLGNPALLAFYALLLPLITPQNLKVRWCVYFISFFIILLTQTWWAGVLLGVLGVWEIIQSRRVWSRMIPYILFCGVILFIIVCAWVYILKPGTILVRFALIADTLVFFAQNPLAWIIGFTPPEIMSLYQDHLVLTRPLVDAEYSIAHSHNFFLESILRLGIISIGAWSYIFIKYFQSKGQQERRNILRVGILFIAMSSVHMPEIIIFLVVACALHFENKSPQNSP